MPRGIFKNPQERIKKISDTLLLGYAKGRLKGTLGMHWKLSEETKIKQGEAKKKHNPGKFPKGHQYWKIGVLGRKQSVKERIRRKKMAISQWKDPVYRKKTIKGLIGRRWELSENSLKNILKSHWNRPTSLEKQMIKIIKKYKLPYKYVGDGQFILGGKCPDFINTCNEKICLEVHNFYHHPAGYRKERAKYFKKLGWKTIFINEDEINNVNHVLKILRI